MRRGDDRAVTVQIGAVLLLAILFSALALYQINVVPEQNSDVEYNHNQEVHNEMHDLRNAIGASAIGDRPQSTTITLGTQYPTRLFAINPPDPQGTLETTGEREFSIENATLDGQYYRNGAPIEDEDILGTHTTSTIAYESGYNEYRTAPVTRIEHAAAFNDFDGQTVSLPGADQQLVTNDSMTVTLFDGEISESATGAVTIDTETKSGPSEPIDLAATNDDPITISVPTDAPDHWNETLGTGDPADETTGFDEGERGVRTVGYDHAEALLTIEFQEESIELEIAEIGVGNQGEGDNAFDIEQESDADDDDGGATDDHAAAYRTVWADENPTTINGTSATLTMGARDERTGNAIEDGTVQYAVNDSEDIVEEFTTNGQTNASGQNETSLTFDLSTMEENSTATVDVYTSSGGSGDVHTLQVTNDETADSDGPSIDQFDVNDETQQQGESPNYDVQYDIDWEVSSDNSLREIVVRLRDSTGATADSEVIDDLEDYSESGDTTLVDECNTNDNTCEGYRIEIEVTDENDQSSFASIEDDANGDGTYTRDDGESGQVRYASGYVDGNGGSSTPYYDETIPPGADALGTMNDFEDMIDPGRDDPWDDYAVIETQYHTDGQEMAIGTQTEGISSAASEYELEVEHRFYNAGDADSGEIDLRIVDDDGNEYQRESIDDVSTDPTTLRFDLNEAATTHVQETGDLYVIYDREESDEYTQMLVYYQRLLSDG